MVLDRPNDANPRVTLYAQRKACVRTRTIGDRLDSPTIDRTLFSGRKGIDDAAVNGVQQGQRHGATPVRQRDLLVTGGGSGGTTTCSCSTGATTTRMGVDQTMLPSAVGAIRKYPCPSSNAFSPSSAGPQGPGPQQRHQIGANTERRARRWIWPAPPGTAAEGRRRHRRVLREVGIAAAWRRPPMDRGEHRHDCTGCAEPVIGKHRSAPLVKDKPILLATGPHYTAQVGRVPLAHAGTAVSCCRTTATATTWATTSGPIKTARRDNNW